MTLIILLAWILGITSSCLLLSNLRIDQPLMPSSDIWAVILIGWLPKHLHNYA